MGNKVNNEVTINFDKIRFIDQLGNKTVKQFHREMCDKWGIKIHYSSFISMINNNSQWMLLYAWIVCKELNQSIEYLFSIQAIE